MSFHSIVVQWSHEDDAYIAIVPELPGLSAFGSSPEKALEELSVAKKAYLEVLQEDGEEVPTPDVFHPFSGQTRIRLPKSLHASLSYEAKKEGVSLNTHIVHLLSERNALNQVMGGLLDVGNKVQQFMLSAPTPTLSHSNEAIAGSKGSVMLAELDNWGIRDKNESSH